MCFMYKTRLFVSSSNQMPSSASIRFSISSYKIILGIERGKERGEFDELLTKREVDRVR
jgi:hypothetical protein